MKLPREAIIEMAKKAGLPPSWYEELPDRLEAFAAEVIEMCAKVCDERAGTVSMFANSRDARTHNSAVKGDAAAIRALSPKEK